ncbi:MAG: cell division protein FtsZ, partial [Candidatus Muiribacteriota bacterium]
INLDFADVKAIMTEAGSALMGIGIGTGENRAVAAAEQAVSSPLLEATVQGAKGVLINITGGEDLTLYEVNKAAEIIANSADPDANIIFGAVIKDDVKDMVKVTVIATGFSADEIIEKEKQEIMGKLRLKSLGDEAAPAPIRKETPEDDVNIPAFLRKKEKFRK